MKFKYLGTAAAEGIPALFCECENCKKARKNGGKDIRTRSQAIIDDKILIDFPADTYCHTLQHGLDLARIKTCLITHSHSDHLYAPDIEMRKNGFSHIPDCEPLTFYSDKSGYDMLKDAAQCFDVAEDRVQIKLLELYKPFEVEGYTVTAIRAAHGESSSPVVFLIERDGKVLFYSNDTSEYPDEAMEYLKNYGKHIDVLSLDCTEANAKCTYVGHLTLSRCVALVDKLKEFNLIDDDSRVILNHFSHNGVSVLYDDFLPLAKEHGFEVAYDGMEVEI